MALSGSVCRWLYRDSFHELRRDGGFADTDMSADVFAAALACYLPVKDSTDETVEAAVTKAFICGDSCGSR